MKLVGAEPEKSLGGGNGGVGIGEGKGNGFGRSRVLQVDAQDAAVVATEEGDPAINRERVKNSPRRQRGEAVPFLQVGGTNEPAGIAALVELDAIPKTVGEGEVPVGELGEGGPSLAIAAGEGSGFVDGKKTVVDGADVDAVLLDIPRRGGGGKFSFGQRGDGGFGRQVAGGLQHEDVTVGDFDGADVEICEAAPRLGVVAIGIGAEQPLVGAEVEMAVVSGAVVEIGNVRRQETRRDSLWERGISSGRGGLGGKGGGSQQSETGQTDGGENLHERKRDCGKFLQSKEESNCRKQSPLRLSAP